MEFYVFSFSVSYKDVGFRAHSKSKMMLSHFKIINLITSAKPLFSNNITVTYLGGTTIQPTADGNHRTHFRELWGGLDPTRSVRLPASVWDLSLIHI